jgi:hypothetical protein
MLTTEPSQIDNHVICDNNNRIYVGIGFRVLDIHFKIIIGNFKNTIKYVEYPMNITPLKSSFYLTWFMSLQWSGPHMHAFESKSLCKLKTPYISI